MNEPPPLGGLPLFDTPAPLPDRMGQNLPEFSVAELTDGIRRALEGAFERVRVRGEVSQPKYHSSGHLYFILKDEGAVIDATCWKARVGRLPFRLEEGMDVVVTGQVTSYAKSSKYQINVESVALAGQGALLKLLQERKERLGKEGLFDAARKRALPRFPQTIGVITSPTGAVIQDILHRLEDRWPCRVLLWPVAVQGDGAAAQVAAAIAGLNARDDAPDVIIVARGGGSLEDLMPFNDEAVVRAAAASRIPLVSAVGHETDTTLIDYAADVRAPTPTAAAELATPVRRDIIDGLALWQPRAARQVQTLVEQAWLRLGALHHQMGNPQRYAEARMQALDMAAETLRHAGQRMMDARRQRLAVLQPPHPRALLVQGALRLQHGANGLRAAQRVIEACAQRVERAGALLHGYSYQRILANGFALVRKGDGRVVTAAAQLRAGDAVTLTFGDGLKNAAIE